MLASKWLFPNRAGEAYTDSGFKSIFGKLAKHSGDEDHARVRCHDGTPARGTMKLRQDGPQAHEVIGHLTEEMVECVYGRRKTFRGRAVE
ncbi:MAG TPA: hypothetical protein VHP37_33695 [Burkholderiales bacterium]|nr:hypothetical protein [Burkholderiales bacterium]